MKSILPFSWSGLDSYNTCPRQYYELKIARNFEDIPHESMQWGTDVHEALEFYIKDGQPLTERYIQFEPIISKLNAAPGDKYPELKLAVDHNLELCDFDDPNAWTRGIDDLAIINGTKAISIDYKTGKKKPFSRQLELSACRLFTKFPAVVEITTAFAWLATKEWTVAKYTRAQLPFLWEGFYEGVAQMLWSEENNVWPAKPSGLCKKSKRPGSTYQGCAVATCPHSEYFRRNK